MTIEAELADGRVLEFPDGTSPTVIQGVVKRLISGGAPTPAAAPAATSTAADNLARAQAAQNEASKGPEQISIPQAELAAAEKNAAALRKELARKGVDAGAPPAIGSTKAGEFLLAQGAQAQGQQPAPAAAVVPPAPPPALAPAQVARTVDDRVRRTPSLYDVQSTTSEPAGTVAGTQTALNMAGVSPQYVSSLEAQFNQLDPAKRIAALQQALVENPRNTVKGRAVRAVAARNKAWGKVTDPATSYISGAARKLSSRVEDVTQELIGQGVRADIAPGIAANRIAFGAATQPMAAVDRDVVGEQAAAAAEQQAKELKDAGLAKRVEAGVMSEGTKSVAGVGQFLADITGDKEFSRELANTQRIEGARTAAIPQGEGVFDRSLQGAATSLAAQAPFLVLSALTGSSAPVLAQVGLTSFGKSYGEGRAAGLDIAKSATRATAMTAAEIIFERLGMTKALAGLKAFVAKNGTASIPKYLATSVATELPPEIATAITQYGIDVLPSVGLNKKPSLIDLYQQVEETLRQTVLQAGATAGITVAGVKGVQGAKATPQAIAEARERLRKTSNQIVGIEKTNELLGPREGAYERPGEISRAKLMAEAKRVPFASTSGALNAPPAEKAAAEPKLGDLENVGMREEEEPGLGSLENVRAEDGPPLFAPTAEDTEAKVNAIAERLRSRGIPRENALRIAQKQIAEEAAAAAGPAAVQPPNEIQLEKGLAAPQDMSKLSAWPDALLAETLKMQEAQEAPNKPLVEALQAELQRRAQTQGAQNVAGTEPTPSGESVSVAGQPGAETPGGLETPARDGVVPTEPDAGLPATGEVSEPAALEERPKLNMFGLPIGVNFAAKPEKTTASELKAGDWIISDGKAMQVRSVSPNEDGTLHIVLDHLLGTTPIDAKPTASVQRKIIEQKTEEGTTDGTETVEAKQAEAQEQEAPAAPVKVRNTEPVVNENGAFIPAKEKGGELETTAHFKVLDEDNDISDNLVGATMITGMGATKEGQGEGSKLLKAITAWADANGKKLVLVPAATPKGERGLSQEQLKAWYVRNGFEDRIDYMVREPGGKKAEAPAAPKPPKAAKPGKEVHTTPQNAEGKWSHAINGEVVKTYDTKTQAIAAMLLNKAQKTGNEELIAKRQKIFDGAMNPQQRGRPPKLVDTLTEDTEEAETARAKAAVEKANADAKAKAEAADKAAEKKPTAEEKFAARAKANVEANQKAIAEKAKADAEAKAKADARAEREKDEEQEQAIREKAEAEVDAGPIGEALRRIEDGDRVETKAQLRPFMFKLEKNGVLDDISDIQEALSDREQTADDVLDIMRDQLETARDDAIDERVDELTEEAEQEAEQATEEKQKDPWEGVKRTTRGDVETVPTSSLDDVGQRNKVDTSTPEYAALKASIEKTGIVDPITLTTNSLGKPEVFEGNHRLQAARELGLKEVPVVLHSKINPSESRPVLGTKPSEILAKTKAPAAKATEPKPNLTAEEKERLEELDDIYRNATNNPNTEGGKAARKTLERVTKDTDEPKVVRERAKAMLAGEYSAPADDEFFIQAAQGKKDLAFSKFTTSSQTLSHIIKTGTDFQKRLARRLRSTVRNVKMVVVEKGQELPASVAAVKDKWNRALALYNTNEKVVYTKGESYGRNNGLNAVVQLHELFHGATSQKIRTALAYMKMGRHVDSQMVKAVDGLEKIMNAAAVELNKQIEAGTVDPDVHSLAVYGEAFTNLHEFVSYGNTDAKLQEFLKGVKGFEKDEGLFSPFVDALRRLIGVAKEDANALSDLVQHTDQLISSRRPGGWGFPEVGVLASAIPRTQEEMDADSDAAWSKVTRSQLGQQRAAALSSVMALRDPRVIWARLGGVWDKLDGPTRKAIALTFDRNGIANTIGKHIPALVDIADRLQKMDGMAASLRAQATKQAGMVVNFARKDRKAMKVLDRLIPASTLVRYDPSNPPANGVRDTRTDTAYASLGAAGQRVYREIRDYFADMHRVARDIMEANVDGLDLPSDTKQKLMGSIRLAFEEGKIEPYFPLMRFGDFVFRIKERGSAEYESFRFETKAERDFAAKAYAKEQGVTLDNLIEDNEVDLSEDDGGKEVRGIVEGNSKLLKELYGAIDSMDLSDPNAKAKLKDNMYQVYLDLMPEASVRKQFMHREEVTGFGTDTLRMINAQGIKIASALSKLQYGNEIRNLSEQAHRQLKGKEQYKAFVGAMDAIADEALSPKPLGPVAEFFDPVAQQWTKFTFFHNLTSLSSALMQPADIMLTGAPVLVGNHGPKAMVELTKMANVVKQFGVWETLPDGTKRFRAPSIAYATGLPQVELDAIADMVNEYGLSADTLANEIFDAATKPVNKADPKAIELAKDAGRLLVLGGLMHHTERLSREVLGAASFRLYYAEMEKASPGNPSNYANAVRAAVAEVNEALGDYSPGNRPQIMRGPIGKLASTYKFFPLTRIKLLGGNFFRMIPFLNKEGKLAAATKFFGILGTHSVLTGVVGLPMYGLIQALWGQWQKDEDAPQTMKDLDHDTWWRTEYLRKELDDSKLTKFVKDVAKSGLANYATGMAISERLGLNDMVFRTPDPAKNLNEAFANYAAAFFGAQLTPIRATQDSWDYYSQGEYQKAFEALPFMPKSIGALSATERISREGVETKQGVPILDKGEATTKELIGQALGFQSARVAEARRIAHATDIVERGISSEKQAIVGKAATMFLKAINPNRDPEDRQRFLNMYLESIQKIPKFNVKHPEHGIDGKEIDAKIDAELEKIAASKMFGGVKINDNNIRLFIQAALASREALNNPK